jgi:hypothetical protein
MINIIIIIISNSTIAALLVRFEKLTLILVKYLEILCSP